MGRRNDGHKYFREQENRFKAKPNDSVERWLQELLESDEELSGLAPPKRTWQAPRRYSIIHSRQTPEHLEYFKQQSRRFKRKKGGRR
ncbi:hypothetical protein [Halobacillus sp. Marseille-Q1614]|uniref:hypothetical protein n=1 Tax=Halobacillus sp. Marseille-Q1614 TaxID=2709134 RepID=UPI00156E9CCB|nr:hypothetical protein [Halobacillus sp. Marseille-Q1614]